MLACRVLYLGNMNATKTRTTRQLVARALRTVRAAATMERAGVVMTYRPGSIVRKR